MYVESQVIKLDIQCDQLLPLSLFLIASVIGRLNYWWIFFDSLSHASGIADESPSMPSSRASCPKLRNQADWGHKN